MDRRSSRVDDFDILRHAEYVRRVAGEVCEPSIAEDVAQEALLRALERRPRREGSLRGWFATVILNRARELRRLDGRRFAREVQAARREPAPSTVDDRMEHERRQAVASAVDRLREPYRSTLILRFSEDLPAAEIAARQDVSAGTARSRIHRGLELLRADARLSPFEPEDAGRRSQGLGAWILGGLGWLAGRLRGANWESRWIALGAVGAGLAIAAWWGAQGADREAFEPVAMTSGDRSSEREVDGVLATGRAPRFALTGEAPAQDGEPLPAIAGRCVDGSGAPIAGALVSLHVGSLGPGEAWPAPSDTVHTASDGSFRLPAVTEPARIWAQTPDLFAVEYLHVQGLAFALGAAGEGPGGLAIEDVRLVLAPASERTVRVVDAEGHGLADAHLAVSSGAAGDVRRTATPGVVYTRRTTWTGRTGVDGGFETRLPPGELTLAVSAPGYLPRGLPFPDDDTPVTLERLRTMRLVVVDSAGRPISGAEVRAFDAFLHDPVRTDPDGGVWLTDVGERIGLLLRVEPPLGSGAGATILGPLNPDDPAEARATSPRRLAVPDARTLRGRVLDAEDRPVSGQRLRVAWEAPEAWSSRSERVPARFGPLVEIAEVCTEPDGTFAVDGLGDLPVRVTPMGVGRTVLAAPHVARPGEDEVILRLPSTARERVRGRVRPREPGGSLLGGEVVAFLGARRVSALLSPDGSFELDLDAGRTAVLQVTWPEGDVRVFDVPPAGEASPGGRDVDVGPWAERTVQVTVVDAVGARMPNALVFPRDRLGRSLFTPQGIRFGDHVRVSKAGEAELRGLPREPLELLVRHPLLFRAHVVEIDAEATAVRVELPFELPSPTRMFGVALVDGDGGRLEVRRPALFLDERGYHLTVRPPASVRLIGRWIVRRDGGPHLSLRSEVQLGKLADGAWYPARRDFAKEGHVQLSLPDGGAVVRVDWPGFEPFEAVLPSGDVDQAGAPGGAAATWILTPGGADEP